MEKHSLAQKQNHEQKGKPHTAFTGIAATKQMHRKVSGEKSQPFPALETGLFPDTFTCTAQGPTESKTGLPSKPQTAQSQPPLFR